MSQNETNYSNKNYKVANPNIEEIKYIPNGDTITQINKLQPDNVAKRPDTWYLYFIIFTGLLPSLSGGAVLVWTSPVLPSLQSNNTDINPLERPITTLETSCLAALPFLVSLIGCFILPKLADVMGRKKYLIIMAVCMLCTLLGKAFSRQLIYLIVNRCVFLIAFIALDVVQQIYLAEICEEHNKAKFFCFKSVCLPLGNMYSYAFGPYFSVKIYTVMCAVPLVPFLILFLFAPESPVYSLSKGNIEDCKTALEKFRRNKTCKELDTDFNKMYTTLNLTKSDTSVTLLSLFKTKEARIATTFALFLFVLPHSSGLGAVASFLGPLLHAAGTSYPENIVTTVLGLTQVVALLMTSLVIEKIGRKVLLISSCAGCCVSTFLFGLFYYLKMNNFSVISSIQWLPIVCIIAYFFIFATGLGVIPVTIVTEIFTSALATIAMSFAVTVMTATVSITIFIYPILTDNLGIHWCMWIYSICSLAGAIFVFKMIPETKGKSSLEIQEILKQY